MKPIHYPHSNTTAEEAKVMEARYEKIQMEEVRRAFESSGLGLTPVAIRKPDSYGTRHVIYIVDVKESDDPFVFRSNIGYSAEPELVLAHEKLMTDNARAVGVPVNEILYVDTSRKSVNFDFQIQKTVPGYDLEDHFSGTETDYAALGVQIGEITARLHTVKFEGFGRFDTRSSAAELVGDVATNYDYIMLDFVSELEQLQNASIITDQDRAKIVQYFADRKELMDIKVGSLVHYDIADHNIMFKDTTITGLIDWEAAVSGDPILDIASMPTWATHYPRLEDFLEGYKKIGQLPDSFEDKMALYKTRTLLWKTVFCHNANILNEARTKRFYDCLAEVGIRG